MRDVPIVMTLNDNPDGCTTFRQSSAATPGRSCETPPHHAGADQTPLTRRPRQDGYDASQAEIITPAIRQATPVAAA